MSSFGLAGSGAWAPSDKGRAGSNAKKKIVGRIVYFLGPSHLRPDTILATISFATETVMTRPSFLIGWCLMVGAAAPSLAGDKQKDLILLKPEASPTLVNPNCS